MRATYDAAQTTPENRRHWANADALSANAAANPKDRRTVRNRARYEVANNSYARGIVLTLANDVIGTGPRLQMLTDSAETNATVEREFSSWARAVDLAGKLRTMRMARAQDGEAFAVMFSNGNLASPVKLDLRLVEAEQVTGGSLLPGGDPADGIEFDQFGNPTTYHVLKRHPGDALAGADQFKPQPIPAASMIHWFRCDRPGQSRGLPDIMPALPLFAQLRRYTLAVIAAAESAADWAVVMKTDCPANGEAAELVDEQGNKVAPGEMTMELEPRQIVFAPDGWSPSQLKAEQPATTYDMFKREILNEIARCLNMPFNIAACNSSGYNYSSGRLDHQTYYKSIRVDQSTCELTVLDRILSAWLAEAARALGLGDLDAARTPHQWFWDGHEHVDPAKEANAQASRLANHTTTLAAEYARQGKDWETELRQRAKEVALMASLNLPMPGAQPGRSPPQDSDDEQKADDQEQDQKQEAEYAHA